MAEASSAEAPQRNIAEELIDVGKRAFDPAGTSATQSAGRQEYDSLIER